MTQKVILIIICIRKTERRHQRLSRRKSTLLNLRTNSKGSERYSTLWVTLWLLETLISSTDPMGDNTSPSRPSVCINLNTRKNEKKKKKKKIKFIIPLVLSFLTLYRLLTCYLRENNKRKSHYLSIRVD